MIRFAEKGDTSMRRYFRFKRRNEAQREGHNAYRYLKWMLSILVTI